MSTGEMMAQTKLYLTIEGNTVSATMQDNVATPPKVKKMALLMSSHSPGVYDAAVAQYKYLCGYWNTEDTGIVTAKIDEQKTDAIKQKIHDMAARI